MEFMSLQQCLNDSCHTHLRTLLDLNNFFPMSSKSSFAAYSFKHIYCNAHFL